MQQQQSSRNNTPAGVQLLDTLKSKHLGFYSLHLFSKTLLSRSLGFSFVTLSSSSSSSTTKTTKNNIDYQDVIDINIIGMPVAVGDVAHCASEFLKHADANRTLAFAVENLVADRRFGVSVEQQQEGSFNFDREIQQGVELCRTLLRFVSSSSTSSSSSTVGGETVARKLMNQFLPSFCSEEWSDGVIRMAKSRVFSSITRLLCKGLFLAEYDIKMQKYQEQQQQQQQQQHHHQLFSDLLNINAGATTLLTFPLRSKSEIEFIMSRERKRLHSSSHSFTSSQFGGNNNNNNEQQQNLFDLLCPEAYSAFPGEEGHILRTTDQGLLHDAVNQYLVEDGIPLITVWNQDAKMLLNCLIDVDIGNVSEEEGARLMKKKKKRATFSNDVVLGTVYSTLVDDDDDDEKELNNNNLLPHSSLPMMNTSTFYSGQESLDAFISSIVQGDETAHKKALALMMSRSEKPQEEPHDNDKISCIVDDNDHETNEQHLIFIQTLLSHPLCLEQESITGVRIVDKQQQQQEQEQEDDGNGHDTNQDADAADEEQEIKQHPNDLILVTAEHDDQNNLSTTPGIEIKWHPRRFFLPSSKTNSSPQNNIPSLKVLLKRCLDVLPLNEDTWTLTIPFHHDEKNDDDEDGGISREPSLVSTVAHYRNNNSNVSSLSVSRNRRQQQQQHVTNLDESNATNTTTSKTSSSPSKITTSTTMKLNSLKKHPSLQVLALVEACGFPLPENDGFAEDIFLASGGRDEAETSSSSTSSITDAQNDENNLGNPETLRNPFSSAHKIQKIREFWSGAAAGSSQMLLLMKKNHHNINNNKKKNHQTRQHQVSFQQQQESSPTNTKSASSSSSILMMRSVDSFPKSVSSTAAHLRLRLSQQVKLLKTSVDRFALRVTMEQFLIQQNHHHNHHSNSTRNNNPNAKLEDATVTFHLPDSLLTTHHQDDIIIDKNRNNNKNKKKTIESIIAAKKRKFGTKNKNKNKKSDTDLLLDEILSSDSDDDLSSSSSSSSSDSAGDFFNDDDNSDDNNYYFPSSSSTTSDGNHHRHHGEENNSSNNNYFSHLLRYCGIAETLTQFETFMNPKFIPYTPSASLNQLLYSLLLSSGKTTNSNSSTNTTYTVLVAEVLLASLLKAVPLSVMVSIVEMYYQAMTTFSLQNEVYLQSFCNTTTTSANNKKNTSASSSSPSNHHQSTSPSSSTVLPPASSSSDSVHNNNNNNSMFLPSSNDEGNGSYTSINTNTAGTGSSHSSSSGFSSSSSSSSYLFSLKHSPSNIMRLRAEFLYETGMMQQFSFIASYALLIKTLLAMIHRAHSALASRKQQEQEEEEQQQHEYPSANKKKRNKKKNDDNETSNILRNLISESVREQALAFADTTLALLPDWSANCLHLLEYFSTATTRKQNNLQFLSSLGNLDAGFVPRLPAEKSHIYGPLLECVCLVSCELPQHGGGLPLGSSSPDAIVATVKKMNQLVESEFTRTIGRSLQLAKDTIGLVDDEDEEEVVAMQRNNNKSVWPLFCRKAESVRSNVGTRVAFSSLCLLSEDGAECLNPLLKLRLMSRHCIHLISEYC